MTLPSEMQRAQVLTDRLHSALLRARHFKQPKVAIELEEAEELVQLLADSLRTAKELDLVEFDGTIKPTQNTVRRLPAGVEYLNTVF